VDNVSLVIKRPSVVTYLQYLPMILKNYAE
jgi:hypothetical protein